MATIKGTINNDLLLSGKEFDGLEDVILGLAGNDKIDAGLGFGGNTVGGGTGNDELDAGKNDLLLGDTGNDELDASDEGGNNSLYGGEGQDTLYAGENDQVFGGAGDDNIFAGTGNNTLYGGTGRDRFWIVNAEVPTSVNTVADFNAQADQIVIKLNGVNSLTNLSFEQTGADTVIKLAVTGESLTILQNTASTVFNSNNVIFDETAPLNATPALNNPKKQDRKTVTGVENLGLVTFTTNTSFKETQVGGLSGIVYDQAQNRYYAISDDRSSINPARFYTLEINLSDGRLDSGDVSFTQVTTLLDSQGNPFPTNSLDTEGIVLTENGSVYISSEGEVRPDIPRLANPFVNEFSLSGQQLSQLPIDDKFFAVDGTTKGIRNNLAFESLTMTPDGRYLYTATENALASDGTAATLTDTSLSRIVKYDLTTGQVVAEFVYEVEPIPKASNPIGGFADNGLVELLAIDNNGTLLSLERSFAVGVGNTVKLYQIQTQGALDVSSFDDLFWKAENTRFAIDSPVKKTLLVDFQADLGITPDNLEGLSLGPVLPDGRQSLIVVSDNNFSTTQTTQFIALGLDIQTTPAVLPVIETADAIDDANGETTTLGLLGDSDDPAVWIDPDNAEDSLIIGTLKDGGLAVFSLDGEVLQKITPTDILGATADFGDLRYNNVDVLYNFQLGTETVDIALVSDRANDTLNLFKIDPTTHKLVNLTSSQLLAPAFSVFGVDDGDATVYGLAGYRSPVSSKSYVFVTQAGGNKIAQLELKADAQELITAEVVRTINLPIAAGKTASDYQSEAIAVDQEKGIVYLAVENEIGIVKFAAEPNGGNTITVVRPVDSSELTPDLEGLAIYYGPNGTGYLVASSQGDSSYAVYSREDSNNYLGSFVVGDDLPAGIDQANETDGLEIINVPLGPTFPFGALLVQDGANNPQNAVENGDELENNNTNFKFVRWDDVANAFETPLIVDTTSYNPRDSSVNPTPEPPIALTPIGTYATGQYNQSAAEIPAYDPASKRLFVVNAQNGKVDVLDASNPTNPTLITSIDTSAFGLPNSVAIKDGLVAIAVENIDKQAKGQVVFYAANSQDFATPLKAVEVGALPDMLTFSPDGKKVLVANEGEPNGTYTNDPEGSVSIIDLSLGINSATVQTADFTAFNSQFAQLKAAGVKFKGDVGTTRTVAQDLEPEYIAVSPDGTKAWVTLQEANAIAIVDIATATVESIKPLGFKDYSVPSTRLETFEFSNLPSIGKTAANQELFLGGFSGLFYEGTAANGNLKFVTHTDRGPNGEPTGSNRPFLLPNFSPEIVRFELDRATGAITITERINLKQTDGKAITGLPNTSIVGGNGNTPYNDEVPVDIQGNPITPLDKLGGDFEAIVLANDGSFWMVDEYRPAIYHFGTDGKLIERFVPQGTAVAAGQPEGTFGTEVLPSILAQRRQNRGFEAVALNKDNNKLYAFVQSPLRNPTTLSNSNLNNLNNVRIIEFDVVTKTVTAEYLYRLDNGNLGTTDNTRPDKIGDAVYIGNGEFLLVERDDDAIDSDPLSNIEKKVYRFSLDGATNVLNQNAPIDLGGGNLKTIDQMTPAELVSQGINLVAKNLHVDLAKAGYNTVEKVEGLTLVDANTIAVLNDNDFQVAGITLNGDGTFIPDPNPEPVVLGLITTQPQELDASDRDNLINIRNWPIFGMYQPDAIASYTANNQTYYITANEGDAREYGNYVEGVRISTLTLDPVAFPNAAELKNNANLGRLLVTTEKGDTDGDGDYDQLYTFGGRSFSIWNNQGQLVFDSGDDFERITAEQFPEYFNASNSNNTFDNRSDDKGPEPEGLVTGKINDRIYAFVGLERIGGVMIYDVTNPVSPTFVQYVNNRDFTAATNSGAAKDLGPEGLAFISAQDSPNGKPLLVVANEVSGTTTFYEIDVNTLPVNNPPTAVILSNTVTQLTENTNTAGGIKVAGISITDDGQGTNVLSLSGADATSFEIRNDELFFIGNSPDFETKTQYDVTVNVDDTSVGETPDASTDFTLNITDIDESLGNNPPTAVVLSNKVTELAENTNTAGGIKVAGISITDDGQGTNVLSLSGADATSFEIRGNELFFIGNSPDFETKTKYDVTVNVDDTSVGETPDASASFTLTITDVNEIPINNPPTAVTLSNLLSELTENSNTAGGIKVADISITDDGQGTNVLSLSGADATSFEIRNNELFFIGNSPDFETKTKYDVTVNVDDISVGETPDASIVFTLNITNLSDTNISDRVSQFNNKGNNLGTLVYDLSDVSGNAKTQGDDAALEQTDALFHNLVGLYQVENADGAILDTLDLNGNGAINDLLNPGDTGYARTAITNAVNNFVLQMGANGDPTDNTSSSEFGDVLLQGGKRYAPFAITNGGNLIPVGGTLQDGINNFLAQNPNNAAANLANFMTHAVAYFSFGSANPDGAEHLQNRGNNVFGFEDLPGNLGISDFDFNDAVFKFTFIA